MGLRSSFADGADHADEVGLLRVGAVREVETGDIEAGADELAEDFRSAGGRAEGSDDLGATGAFHCGNGDNVRSWVQRSLHESLLRELSHHRDLRMV